MGGWDAMHPYRPGQSDNWSGGGQQSDRDVSLPPSHPGGTVSLLAAAVAFSIATVARKAHDVHLPPPPHMYGWLELHALSIMWKQGLRLH